MVCCLELRGGPFVTALLVAIKGQRVSGQGLPELRQWADHPTAAWDLLVLRGQERWS